MSSQGIEIVKGKSIAGTGHESGRIHSICLRDGTTIASNLLVWTIAPNLLLPSGNELVPTLLHSVLTLYHLLLDRAPSAEAAYVTCYDTGMFSFRVTLYTNTQGIPPDGHGCHATVEVLTPAGTPAPEDPEVIHAELTAMGIFPEGTRIQKCKRMQLGNGFPVLSTEFAALRDDLAKAVASTYENLLLLGKGNGRAFFTVDVLRESYRSIENYLRAHSLY